MRYQYKFLFVLCLASMLFLDVSGVFGDIQGTVHDSNNEPINNASVKLFRGAREINQVFTNETGEFYLHIAPGNYTGLVYRAEQYLPSVFNVNGDQLEAEVTLNPGVLLEFTGDMQFVDSENLPLKTVIKVLDEQGEQVTKSGFNLIYGSHVKGSEKISELQPNQILVPALEQIKVSFNNSYLVDSDIKTRSILIDIGPLPIDGVQVIDLREHHIPFNREYTKSALELIELNILEFSGYGFYLSKQEASVAMGKSFLEQSLRLYNEGDYAESYQTLKKGFLVIENTSRELAQMYQEARISNFILIGFLAISSIILGYLLTENHFTRISVSMIIYLGVLMVFYFTYPGTRIISFQILALASIAILAGLIALGMIVPSLFRVSSSDRRVHTRNLVIPIFSLAKRSLRRRRLRFFLTLISLTLLVTSFVTLTSFSQGYGVVRGRSQPRTSWDGVFIRGDGWTEYEPTVLNLEDEELLWIMSQPEVDEAYQKAENLPLKRPLAVVNGLTIFGLIGGDENEFKVSGLESSLIEGSLPDSGVVVSEGFLDTTGLELGDDIKINLVSMTIEGVFDSTSISRLKDLDGSPYMSEKWVNTNPSGEAPIWVLQNIDPKEQIFTSLETATSFPLIEIQRIGFTLNNNYSEDGFAERLSLEMGYQSYSSTRDGFTNYRLGNYFEGKGMNLLIPWTIVVLNVVVTMLNSLFERRKEIEILSSVGLNPAQVSTVFVAEAIMTGFIAGGMGYLLGLSFYKALAILNIGLQVQQKISAVWSIASIGLAISAVLTGAFVALKNSVVITPSLMRRWKIDASKGGFMEPYTVEIPVKLEHENIRIYLDYVEKRLLQYHDNPTHITSNVRKIREEYRISFIYKSFQTSTGSFYTRNNLRVISSGDEYTVVMESIGTPEWVHVVGSLVRRITMDYASERN